MNAEDLLDRVIAEVRRQPGLDRAHLDAFLRRRRPQLLQMLKRHMPLQTPEKTQAARVAMQAGIHRLPPGVELRLLSPAETVDGNVRPARWSVYYLGEERGFFTDWRGEERQEAYAPLPPGSRNLTGYRLGTSLTRTGLLRFFVPELAATLKPAARPPFTCPPLPTEFRGKCTLYLPGHLGITAVTAKFFRVLSGHGGELHVDFVEERGRKEKTATIHPTLLPWFVILAGTDHPVELEGPADARGLVIHAYGSREHHNHFRRSLDEWLAWEPQVTVLFEGKTPAPVKRPAGVPAWVDPEEWSMAALREER